MPANNQSRRLNHKWVKADQEWHKVNIEDKSKNIRIRQLSA
jgi:hypothetical protein